MKSCNSWNVQFLDGAMHGQRAHYIMRTTALSKQQDSILCIDLDWGWKPSDHQRHALFIYIFMSLLCAQAKATKYYIIGTRHAYRAVGTTFKMILDDGTTMLRAQTLPPQDRLEDWQICLRAGLYVSKVFG